MKVVTVLFLLCVLGSCATGPVEIPEDMTPAKIIQRAQEASDVNKYKIALQYYETLKERYGDSGEYLCTAEYEIAFIHYKQKKYPEARWEFESLLKRYEDVDAALLPPHFQILSEKMLSKLTEMGF
ncbi:MAG: tetratricopeptide repeat protein [Treponema sp.]|jgi:outer membrane protein assembly factor BamD (BamD/ComL family)|nr:tetratricopeptide repeat protein [Treponema sp.]